MNTNLNDIDIVDNFSPGTTAYITLPGGNNIPLGDAWFKIEGHYAFRLPKSVLGGDGQFEFTATDRDMNSVTQTVHVLDKTLMLENPLLDLNSYDSDSPPSYKSHGRDWVRFVDNLAPGMTAFAVNPGGDDQQLAISARNPGDYCFSIPGTLLQQLSIQAYSIDRDGNKSPVIKVSISGGKISNVTL